MKSRAAWAWFVASVVVWVVAASCSAGRGGSPAVSPAPTGARGVVDVRSGDTVIADASVVAMTSDAVLPHHSVVIRGDRIAAVAPSAQVVAPAGATVIEAAGRWVMPGLADMHVHTWRDDDLTMFVAAGVTTIRNMWGNPWHLAWRSEIARGERLGPTIVTAGALIDGDPPDWPGSVVLTRPEDADALVAAQKAAGFDFLKPVSQLSREAYAALVAAGARHGMALAGHVPIAAGLDGVLAAKQRSIEHLDHWLAALVPPGTALPPDDGSVARDRAVLAAADASRLPAVIAQNLAAGSWNCPTLVTLDRLLGLDDVAALRRRVPWVDLMPAADRARWTPELTLPDMPAADFATEREVTAYNARITAALAAAGAPLLLGTDTGVTFVVPGESLHAELELFVAAGVPRPRALRAATADAWRFLGQPHEAGVIEPGARADLVLLAIDPTRAPLPLVPDGVMVRGRWLPRAELDAKLAEVARRAAQPIDPWNTRWDGPPPFAADGAELVRASFRTAIGDTSVGEQRVAIHARRRARVATGQIAELGVGYLASYRFGPDAFELSATYRTWQLALTGAITAGRLTVTGHDLSGRPRSLSAPLPAGGFLAAPAMAGTLQLAERLADLRPGARRQLAALEVTFFPAIGLAPIRYQVERKPDASGRRIFAITTIRGTATTTSELALDAGGVAQLTAGPEVTTRLPPAPR